jgi:hypothetical protein
MTIKTSMIKIFTALIVSFASEAYLDSYPLTSLVLYANASNDTGRMLTILIPLTLLRTLVAIALVHTFNERLRWIDVAIAFLIFGLPLLLTANLLGWITFKRLAILGPMPFNPLSASLGGLFSDFPRLLIVLLVFPAVERFIRSRYLKKPAST